MRAKTPATRLPSCPKRARAVSDPLGRKALVRHAPAIDAGAFGLRPTVRGLSVLEGGGPGLAGLGRAHAGFDVELPPPLDLKLALARAFVGALGAQRGAV